MAVELPSENLSKYQSLEDEYRRALSQYDADVALYERLVAADPKHPDLPKDYERIQEQNRRVRELYTAIDELRRRLGATSRPA